MSMGMARYEPCHPSQSTHLHYIPTANEATIYINIKKTEDGNVISRLLAT